MSESEREQRELYSHKIVTERRKYFFDVRKNRDGDFYLVISEVNARNERSRLMVFEENMDAFAEGLELVGEFIKKQREAE
jgi:uncharacterized protein YpiB (UPF0302 family)